MESILEFCTAVSKSIDLKFNVKKSSVIRIGKRCNINCSTLLLDGNVVSYVDETKYLGIIIKKGITFCRSWCAGKIKFYRCFNAIYSKANFASEDILVNLFNYYCLLIITYACDAVLPCESDIRSLDKLIANVFYKIFHTFDNDIIDSARFHFGLYDISAILNVMHIRFMLQYLNRHFSFSSMIDFINKDKCLS